MPLLFPTSLGALLLQELLSELGCLFVVVVFFLPMACSGELTVVDDPSTGSLS